MNDPDDPKDQTPPQAPDDTVGEDDEQEPGAVSEPGAADLLKAAVKGAKDLENLEP